MPKPLCFGKEGLTICISWFIFPSKPIREKYPNRPNIDKLKNLVLIAQDEKKICRNSSVSNVHTFSHAYFEGVEFYAARRYFYLTKEVREEDFLVSE